MTTIPAPSRAVVAALLLASLAGTLFSSATAQQITARQAAFENLADSQWVRLASPHVAGRHEGRLLQRSPDHLVLSAEPEPLRVAASTIDTLWTRGNAGLTGAIVGGVALGTLGALLVLASDDPGEDFTTGGAMLFVGGIGLAGGAVLGGLTGLLIPKWHRQYP